MATELIDTEQNRRAEETHRCDHPAKWAALVDDALVPMPERKVSASVIKAQASISPGRILVRDHNSPHDLVLKDEEIVDLAAGNVFYTLDACDVEPRPDCSSPAKLVFVVDDRPEVTIRADQTGQTLRDLFSLPHNVHLFRDFDGGSDQQIEPAATAAFTDGPIFFTRQVEAKLSITVNCRVFTEHDGVRHVMTGLEIATLVYPQAPNETRVWQVSPEKREIPLGDTIEIRGCEVFDVVRKKVDGGFEGPRLDQEIERLRVSGQAVSFIKSPVPAVIYHNLRTRPGYGVACADVLVLVPPAYPGQMIDGAYLPANSPLIGRVKGQAQDHLTTADGRAWRQISYHPHNGGGGPAWNPAVLGFHTYVGELLSWLYDAN